MCEFTDKAAECLDLVGKTYGGILSTPHPSEILLNLEHMNSNIIAHATFDGRHRTVKHIISLNANYINDHVNKYISSVIPHEVAHTVCFDNNIVDDPHGDLWMELCVLMGGDGNEFIELDSG
jgi:hypothetical protein